MALIGQIRKNSWLLVIFIGLGLALFIITSMFVGNQIPFFNSQNLAGSIDGEEISFDEIRDAEDALRGSGDIYAQRDYIWNFLVEDALVRKEADALGLAIGDAELEELLFGNNMHPKMAAFFRDPQTGQINRQLVTDARNALESGEVNPDFLVSWNHQKKEVIKDVLQSRLNTLVSKSIFTPTWMVEQSHLDNSSTASFNFVKIPYDEVDNSEVTLEDADLKAYLADHQKEYYRNEETRKIDFVVFEVKPTASDTLKYRQDLELFATEWNQAESDTVFVESKGGIMDARYLSMDDIGPQSPLTNNLADQLFDVPVGSVIGPIVDGSEMKIAKLIDRRVLPDSATSRHILINATTDAEFEAAQVRIDSFKRELEAGTVSFDTLAAKYSQDPGSAQNGGLYENITPGAFVAGYNDVIFFKGDLGKLYSVKSTYGIHLIEPMSRKYADPDNKTERVKIAVITKKILPSDDSQELMKTVAQDFMANNRNIESLKASATENGFNVETSVALKANDYNLSTLASGGTSRDIIKWAFEGGTEVGDVAPEVFEYQDPVEYFTSKLVVAGLKTIQDPGNATIADVRDEIAPIVRNQKKAEIIKGRISGQDLSSIASTFSVQVDTVSSSTFNSNIVGGSNEPEVVASVFNLSPNSVSGPIAGNAGVFVVKLNSKSAGTPLNDIPTARRQASLSTQSQISNSLIQAMKKGADISDLRAKFY